MNKFDDLSNISIFDNGLFSLNDNKSLMDFCFDRKLFDLDSFFKYIENNGLDLNNNYQKREIAAIVKLLKYKYFFEKYAELSYLNIDININKKVFSTNQYLMNYIVNLFEIGFNYKECEIICSELNNVVLNTCKLGELIMFLEEKYKIKEIYINKNINNKIKLLSHYYRTEIGIKSNIENNFVKENIDFINLSKKDNVDDKFYKKIKSISIKHNKIISNDCDIIFNYCKRYDIKTLADLVYKYENNEIFYIKDISKDEISGVINLIYLEYGNSKFVDKQMNDLLLNSYNPINLRKLGFNIFEFKFINNNLLEEDKSKLMIEILLKFLNIKEFDNTLDINVFNNKINLIIRYYFNFSNLKEGKKIELDDYKKLSYVVKSLSSQLENRGNKNASRKLC